MSLRNRNFTEESLNLNSSTGTLYQAMLSVNNEITI